MLFERKRCLINNLEVYSYKQREIYIDIWKEVWKVTCANCMIWFQSTIDWRNWHTSSIKKLLQELHERLCFYHSMATVTYWNTKVAGVHRGHTIPLHPVFFSSIPMLCANVRGDGRNSDNTDHRVSISTIQCIHRRTLDRTEHSSISRCWFFNPLRAKFFRENINISLHFVSYLHIDTTQVVEILPQTRQEPTYFT